MIALVQIAVLLAAGRLLFHVDWGHSPAGLALIAVTFAAACAGFGLLFGALYRTPEQAGATGWIAPLVMAAMGGCWWPLEVVPPWMRVAGHVFPTAWAMDGFHRLISFGEGVGAVWPLALMLIGYAVGATALAVRFLRWD
jgi:ABC-2 type transport system permease protein